MAIKKNIKIYDKRIFIIVGLALLILFILSSNLILSASPLDIISNYAFIIIKSVILLVLIVSIIYVINQVNIQTIKNNNSKFNLEQKKHSNLLQKIKYDYFFYNHNKDEHFISLSNSIETIFGYNKEEFLSILKRKKITQLTYNVFERVTPFAKDGIMIPPYEVEIPAKGGELLRFEVSETPILNEKGEVESIDVIAHNLHSHESSFLSEDDSSYKKIFEVSDDAILIIKGDKFIDSNNKALQVYDCTIEEITLSSPFSPRFSPKEQPDGQSSEIKATKYIKEANEKGNIQFDWVHLKKGKKEFLTEVNLTTFNYKNEQYLLVNVREKRNEFSVDKAIRSVKNRLKDILDGIDEMFVTINKGKEIIDYNEQFESQFFYNSNILFLSEIKEYTKVNKELNKFISSRKLEQAIKNIKIANNSFNIKFLKNGENEITILFRELNHKDKYFSKKQELNDIIDNSRVLLYKVNIDSGLYTYISPSAKEITGYTSEEFLDFNAEKIKKLLHPDDLKNAGNIIAKLVTNSTTDFENTKITYRFLNKSGEYRWFSDNYKIVVDNVTNTKFIIGNIHDITDIIEYKTALKKSEQRFRKTVDNVKNGISIFENGKLVYVNEVLTKITGYSKAELLKLETLNNLTIDADKERVKELCEDNKNIIDFWIKTKQGKHVCIQNKYSKTQVSRGLVAEYVVTSDISDRKRLELAFSENNDNFWQMTNKMPEIIIECDEKLNLVFANKRGLANLNISRKDISKYNISNFAKETDKENLTKYLDEYINGKKISFFSFKLKTNNVIVKIHPHIYINKETKKKGIRAIIINESAQLNIEGDIKITKETVENINQYNKVIISEITKELSSPINSINKMLQLIEKTKLNKEQYNFINTISKSSSILSSIITDINKLEPSNSSVESKTKFQLKDFITDVETDFIKTIKNREVDFIITRNFTKDFLLNTNRIETKNIILKILKTSLLQVDTGIVELEVSIEKKDEIFISTNFIVRNNGNVILDNEVDKINETFKNIDGVLNKESENYQISRTVSEIKRRFGKIEFYKGKNGNNIFDFNILIEIKTGINEADNVNNELKDINILLVEDHKFNQLVIDTMSENWDCIIDIAENGKQAISKLKNNKYDIVLMDIIMPEMNGKDATKFIRTNLNNINSNIPIIAITGITDNIAEEYEKYGFNEVIHKPFTSIDLFNSIINVLNKNKTLKISNNNVQKNVQQFNIDVIEQLSKGDKNLKEKLIAVFLEKYKNDILELKINTEKEIWERVYAVSHGMKPSFNYLKVGKAEAYLLEILQSAKEKKNTFEISTKINLIEAEMKIVTDILNKELKK